MRSSHILPLLALASACSSDPTVTATNTSVEDVQKQVAQSGARMEMRPGRWEGTVTIKNVSPPGIGNVRSGATTRPLRICVAADQARAGSNPLIAQMQQGCTYDSFKLAAGKLDANMTCVKPGVTLQTKITGTFADDVYKLTSVAEAAADTPGPLAGIRAESTIDARRTGDCRGDETKG